MEASWWERLTVGETGSCSDRGSCASKSLIQFSVDGWGCVPSLLFDLRPTLSVPDPAAGYPDPHLCQRLLDTHKQVWVSLLWGHCSFLLGPGVHKVLFVPSKSLFPQSCVSFGSSMVGLMATSSKRAYAIPRSSAPRASAPVAGEL